MAAQPSDIHSMLGSEQFEAPDSSEIDNTPSHSIVSKKRNCTSKIWDYTTVSRNEVLFNCYSRAVGDASTAKKSILSLVVLLL
jgi:hypothetical protein